MKHLLFRNDVHHLPAGRKGRKRKSAPNGLAQAKNIGLYVEIFAGASIGQLSAGFHLVHDEQRPMLRRQFCQPLQITLIRHAKRDVHHDRLD